MKFISYNSNDSRWCRVNGKPGVVDVPNAFTQVLYNYRHKINLQGIDHAIELGTFEGDTAEIFAEHFSKVSTVEQFVHDNSYTSVNLLEKYKLLKQQYKNIDFYNGDSSSFLKEFLTKNLNEQFVFLLDAHTPAYSPVMSEFDAIARYSNRKDHVIMIDDCVDIGGPGWPNMQQFEDAIYQINPNYIIEDTQIGRKILIAYEPS